MSWRNEPGRVLTKSVKACETGAWSMVSYPRGPDGKPNLKGKPEFSKFKCKSWRCRDCRKLVGASDFVRVACATKAHSDWFYAVLTVNPKDFEDRWDAFGGIYSMWQNRLRKRIERFARSYGAGNRCEYIMTFERHTESGWPHVNILLSHPGLRRASDQEGTELRRKGRARNGRWCYKPEWRTDFIDMVAGSGFGEIAWLEDIRNPEAWAGYITKLAHELVGADVKSQTPVGAPKGFRRVRTTRGTMPPTFATLRNQSGVTADRAWALTSKMPIDCWQQLHEPGRLKSASSVFQSNYKEGPEKTPWQPAIDLLGTMKAALATKKTNWAGLVNGWLEIEEIKKWQKSRTASAGTAATRTPGGA